MESIVCERQIDEKSKLKKNMDLNGLIGVINPSPSRFQNMHVVLWADWVVSDIFRTQMY
jgi:hypothetical protein